MTNMKFDYADVMPILNENEMRNNNSNNELNKWKTSTLAFAFTKCKIYCFTIIKTGDEWKSNRQRGRRRMRTKMGKMENDTL